MSGVVLRDISKRFGAVQALDAFSLDVASGEMVVLLGPSGCGKTTLLRTIAGLERADSGQVLIGEHDVTDLRTAQRPIGMVFQNYALFPNMTLRQNVGFPLMVRKRRPQEIRPRVNELLELVHLSTQADRYPHQVSGGQQQRAAVARALAPAPAVLLFDEPLSALDALVRGRLRDELRRIQQAISTTAIYVTHDQSEAMAIADRVVVMDRGRVEQVARPAELYDSPTTPFSATFVGSRNALELPVRDGRVVLGDAFSVPARAGRNGSALVFFRPEDVEIDTAGQGHPVTLNVKIFHGPTTRLHLLADVDGKIASLHADIPSRQATQLELGTKLWIRVNPTGIRVFPAD
ncbi:MAG TPA: ABC transporter ATP-binding protein [Candidatus Limnocylindria bacterium]|nr:ABC transporter ATP-binding protein [Candidatus Limnocylindria bacterium]